ncbi:MAG: exodeoxyribonuclease VII large subunit [Rhodospirillales bacterium]|nr:exodeoxyribonuclease VII large subunit [Alphaproteobacteria bacterium]MCB9986434.1 exodeoxyribonuclease VII large subunit [Rhodospirillales bacterium]USO07020.1 MAG: exodeoxyribonuclease VII large subunit [Rhodospirillales bacterium]
MSDLFNHPAPVTNIPELSVSELAAGIKRTIESAFGYVRVRGEISKVTLAKSGHLYTALKDESAVLDAVAWKTTVARLSIKPQEGMEVVATGRLTTYPGRSNYQLVIESLELAGQGAILKMLEDRKARLAAEGLFDPARKKPLPFLPRVIGVVTSPTGAVIRDILHRIADRFPVHVVLWPAAVQGAGAAAEVARGIAGLNALAAPSAPPGLAPDLIIVARGGGSFEDLMPFNEESVVRAAAASRVPLISAVGHETDVTLIDFAADRRAPTPTGAAEMAVPVRDDLLYTLADDANRLNAIIAGRLRHDHLRLDRALRALGNPARILETPAQRLDRAVLSLSHGADKILSSAERTITRTSARLRTPQDVVLSAAARLERGTAALSRALDRMLAGADRALATARVRAPQATLETAHLRLSAAARMLESLSFKNVLARGFALVRDASGHVIPTAAGLRAGQPVSLTFADGERKARMDE